jgi:hypothetical protein
VSEPSRPPGEPEAVLPEIERRAAVRYACDRPLSCHPAASGAGESWDARALNISTLGIGLLATRSFEPNTSLTIDLMDDQDDLSYSVETRVVRSVPLVGGLWLTGCAFAQPLTQEEVERLL